MLLGEHDYLDDTETLTLTAELKPRSGCKQIIFYPGGWSSGDGVANPKFKDFALLELEKHVDFNTFPHIRPICLPFSDADVSTG